MFLKVVLVFILIIFICAQSPIKSRSVKSDTLSTNILKDYVGKYILPNFSIDVVFEDNNLMLLPSIEGQSKFAISCGIKVGILIEGKKIIKLNF